MLMLIRQKLMLQTLEQGIEDLFCFTAVLFSLLKKEKLLRQTDFVTYCSMTVLQYINCHRQSITILLLAMCHLLHCDFPCDSHPYS